MKNSKAEKNMEKTPSTQRAGRREFLGGAGTLALAVFSATTLAGKKHNGPREVPLHEADFYAPHSDAG
jgi:hypothetical protein